MSKKRRTRALVALTAGFALIAAACGEDDDDPVATDAPEVTDPGADPTTAETSAVTTPDTPGADTTTGDTGTTTGDTGDTGTTTGDTGDTGGTGGSEPPSGEVAMTVTIDLNPDAVWQDGSPITAADFECSWQAALNTPASILTAGYDQISAVTAGESDQQVVVEFTSAYGPYKTLFDRVIQAESVADCNDISEDFSTEMPLSGREWVIDSWSPEQLILLPNEAYWGDKTPLTEQIVMVPQEDQDTEVASLLAGQVDFIYPQYTDSIGNALLPDANVEIGVGSGGDYEGSTSSSRTAPSPTLRTVRRSPSRSTGKPCSRRSTPPSTPQRAPTASC